MWIWLVVAVLAVVGELLSYDLFLAPVALAGFVVALIAPISPVPFQAGLFASLSLLGIAFLRPIVKHALGLDSLDHPTETVRQAGILGRHGIVTQTVDAGGGQIRVGEGEFWTARSFDPAHTIQTGDAVEVLLIEGIAALVEAVPPLPTLQETDPQMSTKKGMES